MNKFNVRPRDLSAEEFVSREQEKHHAYRSGAAFVAGSFFHANVRRLKRQRRLDALVEERRRQRRRGRAQSEEARALDQPTGK